MQELNNNRRIFVKDIENNIFDTTVLDFVEWLRMYKRKNILTKSQWEVTTDDDPLMGDMYAFLVEYDAGTFAVYKNYFEPTYYGEGEMRWTGVKDHKHYHEPSVSSALLLIHIDEDASDINLLSSEVISTYRASIYGKRVPKGFWNMSDDEFDMVVKYEAKFLFDISTFDKAKHFIHNDTFLSRIPAAIKTARGLKLYTIAKKAQPSIHTWDMRTLPRGVSYSDEEMFAAICECMRQNNVDIENLNKRHILESAPSLLNKFTSVRKVRLYYQDKMSGESSGENYDK